MLHHCDVILDNFDFVTVMTNYNRGKRCPSCWAKQGSRKRTEQPDLADVGHFLLISSRVAVTAASTAHRQLVKLVSRGPLTQVLRAAE